MINKTSNAAFAILPHDACSARPTAAHRAAVQCDDVAESRDRAAIANCYCLQTKQGHTIRQVFGFKDASFLGRADVSSKVSAEFREKKISSQPTAEP
jgi:hypothetical protein